ncbi:MAG: hypothetical protein KatS3mg040_0014 [Candidatus Kapaibacterium sp.]|nr:MAG: hypothetical protein KatS3mg040_0014 [Candidatus Kapabacteria bacterium]
MFDSRGDRSEVEVEHCKCDTFIYISEAIRACNLGEGLLTTYGASI